MHAPGVAAKLAVLAFLVLLGLAQSGACWLSASSTAAAAEAGLSLERVHVDGGSLQAAGSGSLAPRRDHILWNAACWLLGVGLAVSVGRRGVAQPVLD